MKKTGLRTLCKVGALALLGFLASLRLTAEPAQNAKANSPTPKSDFVTVNNVKLHYLDWGGDGEAVLFLHSTSWTAYKYEQFAPRFAHQYRVLALTNRGSGMSTQTETGYDPRTQVEDLKGFLDALKIRNVTLIGNSYPGMVMTLLASAYPGRVKKLVYLRGAPTDYARFSELRRQDPTRCAEIIFSLGYDDFQKKRQAQYQNYSPEFSKVKAPALTFIAKGNPPPSTVSSRLKTMENNPKTLAAITDEKARSYFTNLLKDPQQRQQAESYDATVIVPFLVKHEERFHKEMPNLRVIEIEVPAVTGYEFERMPDLIAPHILKFLAEK